MAAASLMRMPASDGAASSACRSGLVGDTVDLLVWSAPCQSTNKGSVSAIASWADTVSGSIRRVLALARSRLHVVVLAPPQQRRHRAEHAGAGGEGEGFGQSAAERRGDEVGEERPAGQVLRRGVREVRQRRGAEKGLHRVVAEECGKEAADGGQVGDVQGGGRTRRPG